MQIAQPGASSAMYCISASPRPHDGPSSNRRPVLHLQQRKRAWGEREGEPKGSSGAGQPPAADVHAAAAPWWWEVSRWMGTYRLWPKVRALMCRQALLELSFRAKYMMLFQKINWLFRQNAFLCSKMQDSKQWNEKNKELNCFFKVPLIMAHF